MFQFRRFPSYAYLIQRRMTEYCSAGFPHSEISGSKPMCGSPKLIAACHVLLRLLMPRHSPCALISLTSSGQAPYPSLPTKAERSFAPLPLLSGAETFVSSPLSQGFGSGHRSRSCRTPIISCSLDHELCRLHRSCQFWLIVITLLNSFRHSIVPQHLLLIALCCLLFISESTLFSFQGAFLWSH